MIVAKPLGLNVENKTTIKINPDYLEYVAARESTAKTKQK